MRCWSVVLVPLADEKNQPLTPFALLFLIQQTGTLMFNTVIIPNPRPATVVQQCRLCLAHFSPPELSISLNISASIKELGVPNPF